jgi:hypothetical protein
MYYMGVDPGLSGAWAIINSEREVVRTALMPTFIYTKGRGKKVKDYRHIDCSELYKDWQEVSGSANGNLICTLEEQRGLPGQSSVATFTFGVVYGITKALLTATSIDYSLVTPSVWKKSIIGPCEEENLKVCSVAKCKEIFPDANLIVKKKGRVADANIAEALLLAEYCRRENL